MARIRSLKPEFFKDEELAELSFAHRILFQGLWCLADREGRLEHRPKWIKAEIFPYDEIDVASCLTDLQRKRFIICYQVNGKKFIQIRTFLKNQRPNSREAKSEIPAPEIKCLQMQGDSCTSMHVQSDEIHVQDREEREGKGNGEWERKGNGEEGGGVGEDADADVSPDCSAPEELSNSPSPKALEPEFTPEVIELTELLVAQILKNHPRNLLSKPAAQASARRKWPLDVERMIRLDSRAPPEIREMIFWATEHSFWSGNILSASKLREKWDTLDAQRQRDLSHERESTAEAKLFRRAEGLAEFARDKQAKSKPQGFLEGTIESADGVSEA